MLNLIASAIILFLFISCVCVFFYTFDGQIAQEYGCREVFMIL